jgi:hypothetical protein
MRKLAHEKLVFGRLNMAARWQLPVPSLPLGHCSLCRKA